MRGRNGVQRYTAKQWRLKIFALKKSQQKSSSSEANFTYLKCNFVESGVVSLKLPYSAKPFPSTDFVASD